METPTAELPATDLPTAEPTASVQVPATASSIPEAETVRWELLSDSLNSPVGIANADDGSNRLFIIEQDGLIRILVDGQFLETPFLDIGERVSRDASERGLLGLDFHPEYEETGLFYVNYTDLNGNTVIARFQVSAEDANQAEPGSESRILEITQPYANHNGGGVVFGPDGYLYLGLGDGGSGGDPQENAENTHTLLGKMLRIDISTDPFAIPAGNPFVPGGGRPEIWAYGLRNPWGFAFDRLTGDLYIADVGQNQWEEIDFIPAGSAGGLNFGWDFMEGNHPYEGTPAENLTPPVFEYDHSLGCSVTGGVVYRGQELPEWSGVYLFGDYCSGNIWGLLRNPEGAWISELLFSDFGNITAFGEDEAGEVYLVNHGGSLFRFTRQAP